MRTGNTKTKISLYPATVWTVFLALIVVVLGPPAYSQEVRPLQVGDIEQLLVSSVTQQRVAQLIQERGVDFAATPAVKNRLAKAGAGRNVLAALESAGEEFLRKSAEAKRVAELKLQKEKEVAEWARKKREEAARRVEDETRKKEQEARQKEKETDRKKAEEERRKLVEAETRRLTEERNKHDEALKLAEANRLKAEETKRRDAEIKRQEEDGRAEEERRNAEAKKKEDDRIMEARKRELDRGKQQKLDAMKQEIDQANPVAHAPPCRVDVVWTFSYQNGNQFTRRLWREGELCRVGRSYYDKSWLLVKQMGQNEQEITAPRPDYPIIGQKWMPFPLRVGDEWRAEFRMKPAGQRSAFTFTDHFTVAAFEKVDVAAGTFMAFKINVDRRTRGIWLVRYLWYSPQTESYVKLRVAPEESHQNYDHNFTNYELLRFSSAR